MTPAKPCQCREALKKARVCILEKHPSPMDCIGDIDRALKTPCPCSAQQAEIAELKSDQRCCCCDDGNSATHLTCFTREKLWMERAKKTESDLSKDSHPPSVLESLARRDLQELPDRVLSGGGWTEVIGPRLNLLTTRTEARSTAGRLNDAYVQGYKDSANFFGHGAVLTRKPRRIANDFLQRDRTFRCQLAPQSSRRKSNHTRNHR